MKFLFNHQNFNVLDLEKSIAFYEEALGLTVNRTYKASDGSFILTYMGDMATGFQLELTWLRDRKEAYDLGDNEFHLAFEVDNMQEAYQKHKAMGCVCYENKDMASTSSMIQTDTGSRSSREDIDGSDIYQNCPNHR